jgi:hypothetical protein
MRGDGGAPSTDRLACEKGVFDAWHEAPGFPRYIAMVPAWSRPRGYRLDIVRRPDVDTVRERGHRG